MIDISNEDGLVYLNGIENGSVDLILTDPPYIISKETGMNKHYNDVKNNEYNGVVSVKTETDWLNFRETLNKPIEEIEQGYGKGWSKNNYLKYGSILGKKYCVKTDYGVWDTSFSMDLLEKYVKKFYDILRKGGTCIIWFDIWKMSDLKKLVEKYKFKQIRLIEWVKTNPQPVNSKVNYLTNCKEYAIVCVKSGKGTFNSSYDKGIYTYPIASGKHKFHPTQKNLQLFEDLIKKHSNVNNIVVDPFLGGGTTAIACKKLCRNFRGCEIDELYFNKTLDVLNQITVDTIGDCGADDADGADGTKVDV